MVFFVVSMLYMVSIVKFYPTLPPLHWATQTQQSFHLPLRPPNLQPQSLLGGVETGLLERQTQVSLQMEKLQTCRRLAQSSGLDCGIGLPGERKQKHILLIFFGLFLDIVRRGVCFREVGMIVLIWFGENLEAFA